MRRWAVYARANFSADADRGRRALTVLCTDRALGDCSDVHTDLRAYTNVYAGFRTCAIYSPSGRVGRHADCALRAYSEVPPNLRAYPDAYAHTQRGARAYRNARTASHTNSRLHADLDTRPSSILSYCRNTPLHPSARLLRGPV